MLESPENFPSVAQDDADIIPSIPHDRDAEESLVGAVLIYPEAYYEVSRIIKPEFFYIYGCGRVWAAFEKMVSRRVQIDIVTVASVLEEMGALDEVGGPAYLTMLAGRCPSSMNALSYAQIILACYERRQGINAANRIAQNAYDMESGFSLVAHGSKIISMAGMTGSGRKTSTEAASEAVDMILESRHFTTGIGDVDRRCGGFFPKEFTIMAGYQGTGKSAWMLDAARKNANAHNKVLLCSLEMTAGSCWLRMACGDMGVDINQLRSDRTDDATKGKVINYAIKMAEEYADTIVIYDGRMTPGDILSAVVVERPDIVFVDTMRNITGRSSREGVRDWYDNTCLFLRDAIAKPENVAVVCLHHLNRQSFSASRRPTMHDLMFAGESDADSVMLLYLPEDPANSSKRIVTLDWIIDKSRWSWTGVEQVNFDKQRQTFWGMSRQEEDKLDAYITRWQRATQGED